jgi:hypothetical protein
MTRISAAHRDAQYEQIVERLSGIGDVWLSVCSGNFEAARRLGMEYSDELRLVSEDLGWGRGPGRSIDLTTPPDVLRRVFSRMRDIAASQRASEEPEWIEARDLEERNRLVTEACQQVLAGLEGGSRPSCLPG